MGQGVPDLLSCKFPDPGWIRGMTNFNLLTGCYLTVADLHS